MGRGETEHDVVVERIRAQECVRFIAHHHFVSYGIRIGVCFHGVYEQYDSVLFRIIFLMISYLYRCRALTLS